MATSYTILGIKHWVREITYSNDDRLSTTGTDWPIVCEGGVAGTRELEQVGLEKNHRQYSATARMQFIGQLQRNACMFNLLLEII